MRTHTVVGTFLQSSFADVAVAWSSVRGARFKYGLRNYRARMKKLLQRGENVRYGTAAWCRTEFSLCMKRRVSVSEVWNHVATERRTCQTSPAQTTPVPATNSQVPKRHRQCMQKTKKILDPYLYAALVLRAISWSQHVKDDVSETGILGEMDRHDCAGFKASAGDCGGFMYRLALCLLLFTDQHDQ